MEVYKIEEIYQIAVACYMRTRSLFDDHEKFNDDVVEYLCNFFISLKQTTEYLEEVLNNPEYANNFHKMVVDLDILTEIHTLISINSFHEEVLSQYVSTNVH